MKFIRVTNSSAVDYIEPYLLPERDVASKEALSQQIRFHLQNNPNLIYFLIALDEIEGKVKVAGFIISACPEGDFRHIFIHQIWVDGEYAQKRISDTFFLRTIIWAQSLGRSEVLMETYRDPTAMTRRWGFEEISRTMSFKIDDEYEAKLAQAITHSQMINALKGGQDGKVERPENDIDLNRKSETDGTTVGAVSVSNDRPERDPVQRTGSTEPDSTVRAAVGANLGTVGVEQSLRDGAGKRSESSPERPAIVQPKSAGNEPVLSKQHSGSNESAVSAANAAKH